MPLHGLNRFVRQFLQAESAGGVLLMIAGALAMLCANTSLLADEYHWFLNLPMVWSVGALTIAKPMVLWINDGFMSIFFLLVGLELKREILEGRLSNRPQVLLPGVAALGGMLVPAVIYTILNWNDAASLRAWATPTATDIAFALGVLALLGPRVPTSLKVFLLALAIMDDLGAILIIAIYYTDDLTVTALYGALGCLSLLVLLNRMSVTRIAPYAILGGVLWIFVLKSGVHATLAGVAVALTIPLHPRNDEGKSPLKALEHDLHPLVAFGILPLFAFANAGVNLQSMDLAMLWDPAPLGVIVGLFIGKQLGVFGFSWLAIRLGWAQLPRGATWMTLYGVALITGVGFTMSLFISGLAFEQIGAGDLNSMRLAILIGSLLSALSGYAMLRWALRRGGPADVEMEALQRAIMQRPSAYDPNWRWKIERED
ncbi:Na+/H+ antiporter NhaA [Magnetofaba australis]|uniref:Na(+)/H(+) antiporter NhaA n=1 Tax=Magnetofaba australis IT-1 TaxID=1434232 RepID=A0A1Y2K6M9_9PROT|nr:Na+/H+ antiporter NhaA [Magnetofaba australis]OSM05301.1 putative pH-dependent sodium/proton antiporter [Magnetofaba australis IT-1]